VALRTVQARSQSRVLGRLVELGLKRLCDIAVHFGLLVLFVFLRLLHAVHFGTLLLLLLLVLDLLLGGTHCGYELQVANVLSNSECGCRYRYGAIGKIAIRLQAWLPVVYGERVAVGGSSAELEFYFSLEISSEVL
jgi:hypothetical protein